MKSENQEDSKTAHNSKIDQDLFKNLPSEIVLNILSRLPARTTMRCKCVCKPWLDLLVTPEFVKAHLSKSVPGLAVFKRGMQSKPLKIVEFVDEVDPNRDGHRWNIVFNFNLPFNEPLHSSVNGLLFLCIQANSGSHRRGDLVLCNPIAREYIKLPSPQQPYSRPMLQLDRYGFGVSKMSGQYKVVRLFLNEKLPLSPDFRFDRFECQVYTVGTGSWRRIPSGEWLMYSECAGAFLNGNLHFVTCKSSTLRISCIDLETEIFSTFSGPPCNNHKCGHLSGLRDCLCLCENWINERRCGYEIDIWLMKEYGDVKSWTKDFVIRKVYKDVFLGSLCPIKVFKDGDILMELTSSKLLYYSSKAKTIREVDLSGLGSNILRSSHLRAKLCSSQDFRDVECKRLLIRDCRSHDEMLIL